MLNSATVYSTICWAASLASWTMAGPVVGPTDFRRQHRRRRNQLTSSLFVPIVLSPGFGWAH